MSTPNEDEIDLDSFLKRRRASDDLYSKTDHELLICHSVKIDQLCKLVSSLGTKLDQYAERTEARCEKNVEKILPKGVVLWMLGIIIFSLILFLFHFSTKD